MIVGYQRVSTLEQNTARQQAQLEEYGCERIYTDKMSGVIENRPELKNCLGFLREGDVLVVSELSRLARSTRQLNNIISDLDEKGIKFVSLKESIETKTASGRLLFNVLASIAEFERDIIKERQREGIKIAKEQHKFKGRQRKYDDMEHVLDVLKQVESKSITVTKAAEILKVTRATVYNLKKHFNSLGLLEIDECSSEQNETDQ